MRERRRTKKAINKLVSARRTQTDACDFAYVIIFKVGKQARTTDHHFVTPSVTALIVSKGLLIADNW